MRARVIGRAADRSDLRHIFSFRAAIDDEWSLDVRYFAADALGDVRTAR